MATIFRLAFALGGSLAATLPLAAQSQTDPIAETRANVSEWVELKTLTAKARADWKVEKEVLETRIALYETEIEELQAQIDEASGKVDEVEETRSNLQQQINDLKTANAAVEGKVAKYEKQVQELAEYFPPTLKSKVTTFLGRIPKAGAKTNLTTGERMAFVVGVLNEADKFNKTVTHIRDVRAVDGGQRVEMSVLYFGLAGAIYVDDSGTYGGIELPAKGEWERTSRDDLAPQLLLLKQYQQNIKTPAQFVEMPVTLKQVPALD